MAQLSWNPAATGAVELDLGPTSMRSDQYDLGPTSMMSDKLDLGPTSMMSDELHFAPANFDVRDQDFNLDAASDYAEEERQPNMGSARIWAPSDVGMMSARSNPSYTPAEGMMSVRSNPSYTPAEGMQSARSNHTTLAIAGMHAAHSQGTPSSAQRWQQDGIRLQLSKHDQWPSGDAVLADVYQVFREASNGRWRSPMQELPGPMQDHPQNIVQLMRLVAAETYEIPQYGCTRTLSLLGRTMDGPPFMVRYVSRGQRANGDPVATIAMQPIQRQFVVLEHLAKVCNEISVVRAFAARFSRPECMGVVVAFEELARFFKVHRFEWSDEHGLRVMY